MKIPSILLIGLICLPGCGCASRHVGKGVDYLIGPECKATAKLMNCTPQGNQPPKCSKVIVQYPKGCEVLAIRK